MKYTSINKICPVCSATFSTKCGHRKEKTCCSRKCGNIFFATSKSEITKNKIRTTLRNRFSGTEKSKGYRFECRSCKKEFFAKAKNRKCCSKTCSKHDPDFKKIMRDNMAARIKYGLHKGWKKRSTNMPSYPEKFFMGVLDSMNINYEFDRPFGRWWIDFAMLDKKIALEIDGAQHKKEPRKQLDREKDRDLNASGWKVYRIAWKSINTASGKNYIADEIKKFEHFYRSVA